MKSSSELAGAVKKTAHKQHQNHWQNYEFLMIQYFSPSSSPYPMAVTAWFVFSQRLVLVMSQSSRSSSASTPPL